jgi:glyoxylase I family protein
MQFAVEHFGLPARDPAALKVWYVRVLGATLIFENPELPAYLLALNGGFWVELYPAASHLDVTADNSLAGWRHLALRVDNLEAARVELESRGIVFDQPIKPAGGGGRVLFFHDAEGNLLHLVERPGDFQPDAQ